MFDIQLRDKALVPLWEKVRRGERLTFEDGLVLYRTPDLIGLGKMAHAVQQARSGDAVFRRVRRSCIGGSSSPAFWRPW